MCGRDNESVLLPLLSSGGGRCAAIGSAARVVALGIVVLVAGCASLQRPDAAPPAPEVPAAWSEAAPAGAIAPAASWWAQFGDPALPALVEQALAGATDIAAARARLDQARAQRHLADAALRPSVGGNASAQASAREGSRGEQYAAAANASWDTDVAGAGAASARAAAASAEASGFTLAQARVAVAAEVALTLWQLRSAQVRAQIAQRNLDSQLQALDITRWRREAGLVSELDVEQARASVAQTRAQLPALDTAARQAAHALAVLAGRAPGSFSAQGLGDPALPATPPALALSIPADVLRQRADVRAAERRVAAAAAQVEATDAERWPSLSLGGSIGLNALTLGGLGSGAGVASLAASVSVPLLDGGRLRARVRAQQAALDEARAAYHAAVLGALQDVEDALVEIRSLRAQHGAQQDALQAAQRSASLAETRYRSGLVDFQTVLQSQRTRLSAEDAQAATQIAIAGAHVRLYVALGGGWRPDDPTERRNAP